MERIPRIVIGAIKDACLNIQDMPAKYTKYPGGDKRVFPCERESVQVSNIKNWRIDKESLSQFGSFKIPAELWQCMGQYACWLEPVIVNEWARLMQRYDKKNYGNIVKAAQSVKSDLRIAEPVSVRSQDYYEATTTG